MDKERVCAFVKEPDENLCCDTDIQTATSVRRPTADLPALGTDL